MARSLAENPAKAQAFVMAGLVYSGEQKLTSPGARVSADLPLLVRGAEHPWVSRGGLKLAHGLAHFAFDAKDRICLDLGASTGGFSDVLLQSGAARVYAVDVGYGQLAHKLRIDPRVVVLERTNARALDRELVPDPLAAIVCDASFIGLRTILPAALALAAPGAWLVALIKPQFEVGKDKVGERGIVRDPALHAEVCDAITLWMNDQPGWRVVGLTQSPITGAEGNIEFLMGAVRA